MLIKHPLLYNDSDMLFGNIVYTKHRFRVPKISFKLLRTIISVRGHHDIQHNDTQHNDTRHNDTQHKGLICGTQHKRHSAKKDTQHYKIAIILNVFMLSVVIYLFVMLNVIMLSVATLSVDLLNVIMLSVAMLSVAMLSVAMLSVIMLNVVVPARVL